VNDDLISDLNALAQPLSADHPCGESLEYEPEYLALEEEALGKPEVEYGDALTPAIAPDWKRVRQLVLPLAGRSRDLRLALYLTRAELNIQGAQGLAAGLELIESLLRDHWEHVHPRLDPQDDNDPQLRVNILAGLCDADGLLQEFRASPLVSVPALGKVSLRDVDLASGELIGAAGEPKASASMIEAVFQQAAPDRMADTLSALERAGRSSVNIETMLTERVGFGSAIDLSALSGLVRRAADCVRQHAPVLAQEAAQAGPETAAQRSLNSGDIASREQVRQALDRVCAYFAVHEPTSPVPLLLQRARKLLDLTFMELLQDLAPDGVAQMALVSGIRNDDG
jgi:type VI secretion system protein ImpA